MPKQKPALPHKSTRLAMPPGLWEWLEAEAERRCLSINALIRQAILALRDASEKGGPHGA